MFLREVFCLSKTYLKNLCDSMFEHRQGRRVVVGWTRVSDTQEHLQVPKVTAEVRKRVPCVSRMSKSEIPGRMTHSSPAVDPQKTVSATP